MHKSGDLAVFAVFAVFPVNLSAAGISFFAEIPGRRRQNNSQTPAVFPDARHQPARL
jgi:hypothetical protein